MIQAVLFDMDGVLVDSEKYICKAAIMMFAEKGKKVKAEDFIPFIGTGEDLYIGGVAKKYGLDYFPQFKNRTYEIYAKITKGKLKPLPGVLSFINQCKNKGLKTALATSADKVKMIINLKAIGLSVDSFDIIVTGSEIEKKKPFPDIYLKAAELLNIRPDCCLVVEDAVNGVIAAQNAGCKCLAVTSSFSKGQLTEANWIVPSLEEVTQEVLNW